ncbi:hypothetical protein GJ672_02280 [Spiribacter sp. 2438]|uniref:alpha-E domain-containing protein n=1 Tax=Spiribacter sp. 2438 TaxID=2666185 RepID=UPI0012B116CA|nr:alpha-E domain-containing protein [Spiribacter sp. 2438]QGM21215.1 hypothetical protein GJ672_02280 [Spiribacter sp. 2438]
MMLSRVGEQLYWMSRYLERMDNTARLIKATTQQMLDARHPADWRAPVDILGAGMLFDGRELAAHESTVMAFLIDDAHQPGSIRACVRAARENARTVRELLPTDVWEGINELHGVMRDDFGTNTRRRRRLDFLRHLIATNQRINGIIEGTLSHGPPYHFILLARLLERADMTSRILDKHTTGEVDNGGSPDGWMNTLHALDGYLMYRQSLGVGLDPRSVVRFLMLDPAFPRSVRFCLRHMGDALLALPRSAPVLAEVQRLDRRHVEAEPHRLALGALHDYIDQLQTELADIHGLIARHYFPEPLTC